MTKVEAIEKLREFDRCFLTPDCVKEIGQPFGVYKTVKLKDNRSDFKGLDCSKSGYKEGDEVEGLEAHTLAMMICEKEGVSYPPMLGIGSQLRVCCKAMLEYLGKEK